MKNARKVSKASPRRQARTPARKDLKPTLHCSFCGKTQHDVQGADRPVHPSSSATSASPSATNTSPCRSMRATQIAVTEHSGSGLAVGREAQFAG